ncbi:Sulfite exporter TauE/SafE [Rhodospirillales bacterium URHD0017]|nr:Sulfite exporter TauE/SafE [Rhodospirillales bacterium URHD0017]
MLVESGAARQADEVEVEQLGKSCLTAPRQPMPGWHNQHQPVRPEQMAFEGGGERGLRGDADVGVAAGMAAAIAGLSRSSRSRSIVFVIPAVPYLQAIGLQKDELVQALGLSFTVSTLALAAALAGVDAFAVDIVMPSLLAVVVSLAGMRLGQAVRARLRPQAFRLCFFLGLLALGAHLALRGLG